MWSGRRSTGRRTLRRDATAGSLLLVLAGLLAIASGTLGDIDVSVTIPIAVVENSTVKMTCDYNLGEEPLYSVKWYKSQNEFYRYIPKEMPSKSAFPPLSDKVNLNMSDAHSVILTNIEANQTGRYKCEVSTDSPNFATKFESSYLHVVKLPEGNVTVHTEKPRYAVGDTARANCTAPPASPPVNITWTVNGHPINSSYIRNTSMNNDNRTMVTAKLEFELTADSFVNGRINITCRANVFQIYRNEASVIAEEERPRLASISMPGGTLESTSNPTRNAANAAKSWLVVLAIANAVIANTR